METTKWFRCILCDVYMDKDHIAEHLASEEHISAALADMTGIRRYIFEENPSNILQSPKNRSSLSRNALIREYERHTGETLPQPLDEYIEKDEYVDLRRNMLSSWSPSFRIEPETRRSPREIRDAKSEPKNPQSKTPKPFMIENEDFGSLKLTREERDDQRVIEESIRISNEKVLSRRRLEESIEDEMERIRNNYEIDRQRMMYETIDQDYEEEVIEDELYGDLEDYNFEDVDSEDDFSESSKH